MRLTAAGRTLELPLATATPLPVSSADGWVPVGSSVATSRRLLEEVVEGRARDAPLAPNLLALEITGVEARQHIGLGHAERRRRVRRTQKLRKAGRRCRNRSRRRRGWRGLQSTPPAWFIISFAIAKPTAISAPTPPTLEPPFAMPCAN